jgi:hypothetical protein
VGAPIDYNIPEVWTLDSSYGRIKPMEDERQKDFKRNGACCFRKNGYYYL